MSTLNDIFKANLAAILRETGESYRSLSLRAKLSEDAVRGIFRKEHGVTLKTAEALCDALDVSLLEMVTPNRAFFMDRETLDLLRRVANGPHGPTLKGILAGLDATQPADYRIQEQRDPSTLHEPPAQWVHDKD